MIKDQIALEDSRANTLWLEKVLAERRLSCPCGAHVVSSASDPARRGACGACGKDPA